MTTGREKFAEPQPDQNIGERLVELDARISARRDDIDDANAHGADKLLYAYSEFAEQMSKAMSDATTSVENFDPERLKILEARWKEIESMLDRGSDEESSID